MVGFSTAALAADTTSTSFQDSNFQTQMQKSMDNANFIERAVMSMVNSLFKIAGIAPLPELVFGNPYKNWGITSGGQLRYNLFYQQEMDTVITPLIGAFASAYVTFTALSIMLSSLKMGVRAHSPQAKADFWQDLQMWIASALFMTSFWFLFETIAAMNDAIVGTISDTMASKGLNSNNISVIAAAGTNAGVFGLGDVIIYLGEWVLTVMLNFIYISRKIVIVFLVILAPFAAYSLMFARTRNFFGTWIKELLGNIFLPCIHGLIIYTFASISSLGAGTFLKLGMLIMFIPASGIVSRWLQLGDSGSKLGSALTMSGMSGVAGAMVLGRGAAQMSGGFRRGGSSARGSDDGRAESVSGSGSDYNAGGSLGSFLTTVGRRPTVAGKAMNLTKSSAAVVGGTVGALAGMVAGPGGAVVGGMIGSKVGGGAVTAGGNFISGGINAGKTAFGQDGLRGLIKDGNWSTDLTQRRHLMGNLGQDLGTMVGGQTGGALGRAAGNALSMSTRRRIQTEQFGGMTPQEYAEKFPEADIYWKADSQKSGFYMNRNGQESLISILGSGVAGQNNPVYVPFKTPAEGATVTRGANGSYSMTAPNPYAGEAGQSPMTITPGLKGSTESFLRTGDAYTKDSNGQRYSFGGLDASSINVDSYFTHSAPGMKTGSVAGRALDKVIGTPSVDEHRKRTAYTTRLGQIAKDFQMAPADNSRVKGVL
ncbi:hypothetical protein FPZ49_33685 [Paenibacillus cremeus]|uniref:Uncharacterized protein n=2 Tax=Paenibacillus cremeus TaxID=2163881 RepID=A0A559JHU5_9BACL|nr:hypothetical protein FPZ49_33685 [Paenibacillus cremeus]